MNDINIASRTRLTCGAARAIDMTDAIGKAESAFV
jgi:hypothetical protein